MTTIFKRLRADVTGYLMDVGIKGKVEGSKILPDVTPIHGVPTAVAEAQKGMIDRTIPRFQPIAQDLPNAQGPVDCG